MEISKEIKLPEYDHASLYPNAKCLSSSQFLCYEQSPERFYIEYVVGAKMKSTSAMKLGSIFSACYADRSIDPRTILESHGFTGWIVENFIFVLNRLPVQKDGQPEIPMICEYRGWKFRASLDDYVEPTLTIIENKTGQKVWDQERVNHSDQITFQNWVHWILKGIVARKTILNWWNTKNKTPTLKWFKTSRSVGNLKEFQKRIDVVIDNIEAGNFSNPIY